MDNLSTNQKIPITRYGPEVASRKNVFVTIEVSDKIFVTHFLFCPEIAVNSPLVSCAFLNSMVVAGHFDCTARYSRNGRQQPWNLRMRKKPEENSRLFQDRRENG